MTQFEHALARSPQGEQWAALAAVHVKRGEPEAAIAAWERGFATNHDPRYLHRASKLLLARGEPERSLAQFARANSVEPPSSMIEARIANMARLMGPPESRSVTCAPRSRSSRHGRASACSSPGCSRRATTRSCATRRTPSGSPRRSSSQTDRRDAGALDVLAAALASGDRFDDAVRVGAEADDLALREDDTQLAAAIRERLVLYRAGHAYVEASAKANG